MKKLNQYLYKASRDGIPTLIETYSRDCLRLHSENIILDMEPEQLIGVKICFPEREISDPPTVLWKGNAFQEIFTEKDEPQLESKLKTLDSKLSSPLEASHLEEGLTELVTSAESTVSLESITDGTNGVSGLPELDTSGETLKVKNSTVNDDIKSITILMKRKMPLMWK